MVLVGWFFFLGVFLVSPMTCVSFIQLPRVAVSKLKMFSNGTLEITLEDGQLEREASAERTEFSCRCRRLATTV